MHRASAGVGASREWKGLRIGQQADDSRVERELRTGAALLAVSAAEVVAADLAVEREHGRAVARAVGEEAAAAGDHSARQASHSAASRWRAGGAWRCTAARRRAAFGLQGRRRAMQREQRESAARIESKNARSSAVRHPCAPSSPRPAYGWAAGSAGKPRPPAARDRRSRPGVSSCAAITLRSRLPDRQPQQPAPPGSAHGLRVGIGPVAAQRAQA